MYIYIYIYTYMYTYVYIYIYMLFERAAMLRKIYQRWVQWKQDIDI